MKKGTIFLTVFLLAVSLASAETIIPGGNVSGLWNLAGSPYIVEGDITILTGETLTIEPNVRVQFETGVKLTSNGYLIANGTAGDSICFTSNQSVPQAGDWDGIDFNTLGQNEVAYCIFEYMNALYGENVILDDSRISYLSSYLVMNGLELNRCLVTDYLLFDGSHDMTFNESVFLETVNVMYSSHLTVNSCTMMESLSLPVTAATITDSDIMGGLPQTGNDFELNIDNCTIYGPVSSYGEVRINNCDILHSITIADPAYEFIALEIYDSFIEGPINVDNSSMVLSQSTVNADIMLDQGQGINIYDCTLYGSITGDISTLPAGYLEVYRNHIISGGIDISACFMEWHYYIYENLIIDSPGNGIRFSSSGGNGYYNNFFVRNNTICGAAGDGILNETQYNFNLYNNIVTDCDGYGMNLVDFDSTYLVYNDVYDNELGDYYGVTPGEGSISLDPLFVDPAGGDYSLQRVSPCIDAGDPSTPLDPDNTPADMGAFYYDQDMPVKLTLTPETPSPVIPQAGGEFEYNIEVTNRTYEVQSFDFWAEIELPGWGSVEILNVDGLSIAVGDTLDRDRTQVVPSNAPAGTYTYFAYVGSYPWVVDDYYHFDFVKEGSADGVLGSSSDWLSSGEGFEGWLNAATAALPSEAVLYGAYPNPFNPETVISYQLSAADNVNLTIYDAAGRQVMQLIDGKREAGVHEVTLDGSHLPSGIYFYRITAGDYTGVGKMVLLK